jgi:hypothetical protein
MAMAAATEQITRSSRAYRRMEDRIALRVEPGAASLARPGSNMTGATMLSVALEASDWVLVHEMAPTAMLIGMLVNPTNPRCTVARRSGGPKGARNGNYKHGRYTAETIATRQWLREKIREVRALTRTLRDQP